MQRVHRSNAGNIYKKRREEIQQHVPKAKKKRPVSKARPKSQPTKKSGLAAGQKVRPPTVVSGKSNFQNGLSEDEEDSQFFQQDMESEDTAGGEKEMELRPRRNKKTVPIPRVRPSPISAAKKEKTLSNKFKCPYCPASFAEERYVDFHCKQKHIDKDENKKRFQEAKAHFQKLTQRRPSYVPTKPEITSGSEEHEDVDTEMPDDFIDVGKHMLEFGNHEEYYEKIEHSEGGDQFKCKHCPDFSVRSKHIILTHIQRQHVPPRSLLTSYRCPYCSFQTKTRANLESHMYVHTGVKPFSCKYCDLGCKSADDLLEHIRISHSEGREESYPPKASPPSKRILRRVAPVSSSFSAYSATSSSTPQQRYKCRYCTERFMSELNLDVHINNHIMRGITDEEREEEIRTRELLEEDAAISHPPQEISQDRRPKRKLELSLPALPPPKSRKKSKPDDEPETNAAEKLPPVAVDSPPQCPFCSKVFLYTVSMEKHMWDAHIEQCKSMGLTRSTDKLATKAAAGESGTGREEDSFPPETEELVEHNKDEASNPADATKASETMPAVSEPGPMPALIPQTNSGNLQVSGDRPKPKQLKSVFLLYDPASKTVIPVAPSYLGLPDDAQGSVGAPNDATNLSMPLSLTPSMVESPEAVIDRELAIELERLGTPGTPLSAGADNQHLEHECSVCKKKIVGYLEIVKHLHTHTGGNPCVCHLCNKRFASKASLGVHFLIHLGITFSCPLCNKKLAKKQSLLEHLRFHKGERRYPCTVCGKAFVTISSLNRHRKTTHDELTGSESDAGSSRSPAQVFSCNHCARKFTDELAFNNHIKAHEIMKTHKNLNPAPATPVASMIPMPCQFCGKIWASAAGLSRHLRMEHGLGLDIENPDPPPPISPTAAATSTPDLLTAKPPSATSIVDALVINLSDDEEGHALESNDTSAAMEMVTGDQIVTEVAETDEFGETAEGYLENAPVIGMEMVLFATEEENGEVEATESKTRLLKDDGINEDGHLSQLDTNTNSTAAGAQLLLEGALAAAEAKVAEMRKEASSDDSIENLSPGIAPGYELSLNDAAQ